jgi:phage/plasmid-like protein (TIGR03299 family)
MFISVTMTTTKSNKENIMNTTIIETTQNVPTETLFAKKAQASRVTSIGSSDKGFVGFTDQYGTTPYGYDNVEGGLSLDHLKQVGDYPVELKPLSFTHDGQVFQTENSAIVRTDNGNMLYPSVGKGYTIVDNNRLIAQTQDIITQYSNIEIESTGTMKGGQLFYTSLLIDRHAVKGDQSETRTRLLMTNGFGGVSLSACLNQLRVECMNTFKMANAQGKLNQSLKRFRHTKNVGTKLQNHIFNLADIVGEVTKQNEALDYMATLQINSKYIESTLENLFPTFNIKGELLEGSKLTIAKNKQDKIIEIFESKSDLSHLENTRYKLFNAITDYTSNEMNLRGEVDFGKRMINSLEGTGDKINQQAFDLVMR